MKKREMLSIILMAVFLSSCGIMGDKPEISGINKLTLEATEGAPYIFEISNPESRFSSNTFSNFELQLGDNDFARMDYAAFTPGNISDGEKLTATLHLTAIELGLTNLDFILFYDDGGKTKSISFKVPAEIIGPGINVDLQEKPMFGKMKLNINETKIFHAVITNSIDTRYPNGRLKIKPLYSWVQLKELEGYDSYMQNGTLVIATDLPTSKTIPFMINAVPDAIEAGFSIDVIVEYSSNTTEWAEVARKTIELYAGS